MKISPSVALFGPAMDQLVERDEKRRRDRDRDREESSWQKKDSGEGGRKSPSHGHVSCHVLPLLFVSSPSLSFFFLFFFLPSFFFKFFLPANFFWEREYTLFFTNPKLIDSSRSRIYRGDILRSFADRVLNSFFKNNSFWRRIVFWSILCCQLLFWGNLGSFKRIFWSFQMFFFLFTLVF